MDLPQTNLLLARVARRLRVVAIAARSWFMFLVLGALFVLALLLTRLTGLAPHWHQDIVLCTLPVMAVLAGWLLHRRVTLTDAARVVDRHDGSRDLFLTASMLQTAPGEFKPLVLRDAEQHAQKIKPAQVVPFDYGRPLLTAGMAVAVLAASLFIPPLDLFGKIAAEKVLDAKKQELELTKKVVRERLAELKKEEKAEGEHSDAVDRALKDLKQSLKQMQPKAPKENAKELAEQQKNIQQINTKLTAQQLKELAQEAEVSQQFGGADSEKLKQWTEDLKNGSTEKLQQELEQVARDLEKLQKTTDPQEKKEIAKRLKKRLEDLSDFAADKMQSPQLQAALEKAIEQLDMSEKKELSEAAQEALKESLQLSKAELKQLAQSAKDLKSLEEALKVLKMARKLNDKQELDGEACKECEGLEDYAKLYAKMMAGRGEGEGEGEDGDEEGDGMGKRGIGKGGVAKEDDSSKTDFHDEHSKSPIVAGKVLMTLKSKGVGEKGEAKKEYRQAMQAVKQGLSSAIESDQVPPGYHDSIKSYFDSIEKDAEKK